MALASEQNIPKRPEPTEPWTFKRLFDFGGISTVSKVFTNPLEVLLGWVVFVVGLAVLIGRPAPVVFYILSLCILASVVYERSRKGAEPVSKPKKK